VSGDKPPKIVERNQIAVMFRRTTDVQRVRLKGDPPAVYGLIRPAFARLWERSDADPSRPSIEFYRRCDEIDLLLPLG
jgi:hypothetical protein